MVLVKSWKSWLLSISFWLCLSFLSGANIVEAGYPGIPRSINMGIRVRLCSDWCLREADILSDYPQTSVSCIVRTQYPYFAQRYAGITGFGPVVLYALKFLYCSCVDNVVFPSCHIVFSLYNKKQAPTRLCFISPALPAYIFLQYHINVLAE